jgi:hypothetical protein
MNKCECDNLDDDLIEAGWTCYDCHENHKDNSQKETKMNQEIVNLIHQHGGLSDRLLTTKNEDFSKVIETTIRNIESKLEAQGIILPNNLKV